MTDTTTDNDTPPLGLYSTTADVKKHWGDLEPTWFSMSTPPKEHRIELGFCPEHLESSELYPENNPPNMRYVAEQYGCLLHFVHGRMRTHDLFPQAVGLRSDGACLVIYVSGDTREAVAKARDDIHRTFRFRGVRFSGRIEH